MSTEFPASPPPPAPRQHLQKYIVTVQGSLFTMEPVSQVRGAKITTDKEGCGNHTREGFPEARGLFQL